MELKKCSQCGEVKHISEFPKRKGGENGLRADCKQCQAKIKSKWYQNNKELTKERAKQWKKNNPDKNRKRRLMLYQINKERERYKNKKWMMNHPERAKEIYKRRNSIYRGTLKGHLTSRLSCAVRNSLHNGNKNKRHWEDLVGYTLEQLRKHLERQFQEGMTWGNYGAWHIDHKIPVSAFNFNSPEDIDFTKCWSLKNLRPMWAQENIIKSNKLDKPFQPSLAIAA